jgi:PAS domain S-box-containing protein
MNQKDTPPGDAFTSSDSEGSQKLRAEAILSQRQGGEPDFIKGKSPFFIKRTLHDLQVHQIELEMQNEKLRKAQVEIEAARVRYFDLYDLAPVGYMTLTDEGVILESNYAAAALLGKSRRGLAKQPLISFIAEEDQESYRAQCKQVLETGLPQVTELRMKGRRGKKFWVRLEMTVCKLADRTSEFRIVLSDIAERRKAEEALRDANQKLRLHFEQTPMAVIEWDLDFRVTNWNPAAQTIFGYTREEALGQPAAFIVPEAFQSQVDGVWQALIKKNGGERSTNANLHKNGQLILCEWYNTPLIDESGTVAGVASVVMDITERSEAQQMLAWEKSALELIGSVTPLHDVLDRLMLSLETQLPHALCSVLLLDEAGTRLLHGAAPSLPHDYNFTVDGMAIGPAAGSCGTAAFLKQQVIVEDTATDPLWADFHAIAAEHHLRACWSTPIYDQKDDVLGTFAIYYHEPRRPAPAELDLIERAVHVVRIAIKRKLAEEALLESEQKFRTLFESAGDAILIIDGDQFIDCNARTLELFHGHLRDEIVGRTMSDFSALIQPDGRPSADSAREKLTAALAGQPQFFEWMHRTLHGSTFPAEVSLTPVELGGRILLQAIVRDISERKAAEEEIRGLNVGLERRVRERTTELQAANASLTDFKAALDQHALVSITDSKGFITYANDKFCAISKFSREELIGQNHRIVNSGHHPVSFFKSLWRTVLKGKVWKGEMKDRAKDGTFFWMDTTIVPFLGSGGKPTQFVAIRTDITERKRAEKEIHKLNADLENRAAELLNANKELEAFTYSVSHDLRAPLRAVDGFSRIVLEDYATQLDAEGRRKLNVIRSESQRMGRLIDDLLAFSRLSRQPIEPVEIDMHAMAQSVFAELAAGDPSRNLHLTLHPLPPARGSESLIRQVWVNLIGNAAKFTKLRDLGVIEIGSRTDENGGTIYYVKDNGAGFDMRHSHKLFGVFQRLHSQEDFPGTGVGLALVQRIVHRHNGEISAQAEVDHGAVFSFTLPG